MGKDVSAVDLEMVFVKVAETMFFQVPANTEYNGLIRFSNIDVDLNNPPAAGHSVTVHVMPASGAVDDMHIVCPNRGIEGQNGFDFAPLVLAAGRRVFLSGDVDDKITAQFVGYKTVTS
jgi:hypothetical protein